MALYCTNCRTVAGQGEATCGNCRNGFTSKLACGSCNKVVPSGQAYCGDCDRRGYGQGAGGSYGGGRELARPEPFPIDPRHPTYGGNLPALPGMSMDRIVVPDYHRAGEHGALSEVQMSGNDANILTKMNALVVVLYQIAEDMSGFMQKAESTRVLIKGCRNLAADIQEEVEVRRGSGR